MSATLFLSAGVWVGTIHGRVDAAEIAVQGLDAKHEEAMKEFREMNRQLGEISGRLGSVRPKR